NEDKNRIRIRIVGVALDCFQLLFVRSAAEQRLHTSHEKHLEWRHQRRRAHQVQNFDEIGLGQIKLKHAEVAQLFRHQVFKDRVAATPPEKDFVAHKNINRTQLARLDLSNELVGLCEGPHPCY